MWSSLRVGGGAGNGIWSVKNLKDLHHSCLA
ncbi:hypothetical protein T11_12780 [Trichinella zimbabwensis]|uniref:Uncharacterized protein n=1 Tax=Trichinella zimbabwensis TaxID=268475 RepID=A0A0V1DR03_9BILA|nr:hypothetical protein T11_12780 [Trichinella zimbabwensis]